MTTGRMGEGGVVGNSEQVLTQSARPLPSRQEMGGFAGCARPDGKVLLTGMRPFDPSQDGGVSKQEDTRSSGVNWQTRGNPSGLPSGESPSHPRSHPTASASQTFGFSFVATLTTRLSSGSVMDGAETPRQVGRDPENGAAACSAPDAVSIVWTTVTEIQRANSARRSQRALRLRRRRKLQRSLRKR